MISTFCVIASDGQQERCEGTFTDLNAAEARCQVLVDGRFALTAQVMLMSPATGIYGQEKAVA
jgi:hypothetical protein